MTIKNIKKIKRGTIVTCNHGKTAVASTGLHPFIGKPLIFLGYNYQLCPNCSPNLPQRQWKSTLHVTVQEIVDKGSVGRTLCLRLDHVYPYIEPKDIRPKQSLPQI